MIPLQTMKPVLILVFLFSCLISGISTGVFHGIRIPEAAMEKIVESLDPVVDIKQGTLEGEAELSRSGRVFMSFKGIPFGKVPERFNVI